MTSRQELRKILDVDDSVLDDELIKLSVERLKKPITADDEYLKEERLLDIQIYEAETVNYDYKSTEDKSYFYHEALDRTFLINHNLAEFVCQHPVILYNPELYRLAHIANFILGNLYSEIGNLGLSDEEKGKF